MVHCSWPFGTSFGYRVVNHQALGDLLQDIIHDALANFDPHNLAAISIDWLGQLENLSATSVSPPSFGPVCSIYRRGGKLGLSNTFLFGDIALALFLCAPGRFYDG
jgi:hypothetical protein